MRRSSRSHFRPSLALEALEVRALLSGTPLLNAPRAFPTPRFNTDQPAVVGDFTGDGRPDFLTLTGDPDGAINVLPGRGDGTFDAVIRSQASYAAQHLAAGDFNGDGKLDLVSDGGEGDFTGRLFLGRGDGTFQAPRTVRAEASINELRTADLNGDGRLDLVAANGDFSSVVNGTVTVLLGSGNGTFGPPVSIPSSSRAVEHVALGDITGDGKLDLVIDGGRLWYEGSWVGILAGRGDGTFQPERLLEVPAYGPSPLLALADLNRDGKIDLALGGDDMATPEGGDYHLVVLSGHGNGTFSQTGEYTLPPFSTLSSLVVGDFDGNGARDLAAVGSGWNSNLAILHNRGDGSFVVAEGPALAASAADSSVADLNGDGRDDLALIDGLGSAVILLGNRDGTLSMPRNVPFTTLDEGWMTGTFVVDVTGDGRPDLIGQMFDSSSAILRTRVARADGTWGPPVEVRGVFPVLSLAAADFNGDGFLDLAGNYPGEKQLLPPSDPRYNPDPDYIGGKIFVLLGGGDGSFPDVWTLEAEGPLGLAVADVNGDRRPDLVTANFNHHAATVYLGQGDGTFAEPVDYTFGGSRAGDVVARDLDGDGKVDLAVAFIGNPGASGGVAVLRGRGDGGFGPAALYLNGADDQGNRVRARIIESADLTGDGRLDLVTDTLHVLINRGDGMFTVHGALPRFHDWEVPELVDFDGNGTIDLVTKGAIGIGVALGAGDGSFAPPLIYAAPYSRGATQLAIADLTGDGKPDVVVPSYTEAAIFVNISTPEAPPPLPQLIINDVTVAEGNTGTTAVFTVTLSVPSSREVTVQVQTTNGTAVASADYTTLPPTTLRFAPGTTTQTVAVQVLGNTLDQPDRTFTVQLSNAVNAAVTDAAGAGTIRDDDIAGTVQFGAAAYGVAENAGTASITVTRTGGTASGVTINVGVVPGGTAVAGTDLRLTAGTLTFSVGQANVTLTVTILDNTAVQASRTVSFVLSGPGGGAALGPQSTTMLTIADDDRASPEEQFVRRLYLEILGREVDPVGLAAWTGLLNRTGNRGQVVNGIQGSGEHHAREVRQLYQTLLGRAADPSGLSVFVAFLNRGGSIQQVRQSIAESPEYFRKQENTTSDGFLALLYRDVLRRDIDPTGREAFGRILANGGSRRQVIDAIFGSAEFRRLVVNTMYVEVLERNADPSGMEHFAGMLARGARTEDVFAAIAASSEFYSRD